MVSWGGATMTEAEPAPEAVQPEAGEAVEAEEPKKIEFKVDIGKASKWWNDTVVDEEGNETTVENESLATTSCGVDLLGLHAAESEPVSLAEDGAFEYGLSTTFAVEEEGKGKLFSKILNNGLILTVYDANKEVVGTAEVSLESLLNPGNKAVEGTAKVGLLKAPEGSAQTDLDLAFSLSVNEALQTEEGGLIGRVGGMSLSPVPESLQKAVEDAEVTPDFLVAIQVPGQETLEFRNGVLKGSAITWGKAMKFYVQPGALAGVKRELKKGSFAVEAARYMPASSEAGDPHASAYYYYSSYSMGGLLEPGVQAADVECSPAAPVEDGEEGPKLSLLAAPEYGEKASPFQEDTGLEEGDNAWVKAGSGIAFTVELDSPLLKFWSLPESTLGKLSEFVTAKQDEPKAVDKLEQKKKAFVNQCKTVAKILVRDYGDAFEEDGGSEKTQRNVIFHLNKSGAYTKMKDFLKRSAIDIIEQRIGSSTVIKQLDSHELLNEAYSILLDGVQDALKEMQTKSAEEEEKSDEGVLQKMKMLADEYELNGALDIAERYHVDRISNAKQKTQNLWFDYGQFCLRSGMVDKAEECFREELSLYTSLDTLLALAGVLLNQSKTPKGNKYLLDQAEVFIHSALRLEEEQESHPLAWAMLALLYAKTKGQDGDECQNCIFKATREKRAIKMGMATLEVDGMTQLVFQLLDLSLPQVALDALAVCETIPEVDRLLCLVQIHYLLGEHAEALTVLAQVAELCEHDDARPHVLEGKIHAKTGDGESAIKSFTRVMSLNASACTLDVLLTYGKTLMGVGTEGSLRTALDVFVFACQKCPCASTWLGCAVACIELEDYANAETALTEASVLDSKNAKMWAHTCILSLKLGRTEAALSALDFVLLENLEDVSLLDKLARELASCSLHDQAVQVLRKSLSKSPSSQARKLLADSLFLLGSKIEAKAEYDAVLGDGTLEGEALETVRQQVETITQEFGLGPAAAAVAT